MRKVSVLAFALFSLLFTSCNDDDDTTQATGELEVNLQGLQPLGNDYKYEGWLIVDGQPVSTGTFSSVDFPQTFSVNQTVLDNATKFVLSIEPADDSDPAPAQTKLLAGDFSGNIASVSSKAFLGTANDYSGSFLLATPTDGSGNNELSGVWFTGLNLPTLPAGWKYEGWVVFDGKPLTTGTFTSTTQADDNASTSPYRGLSSTGPNFPGEDYIRSSFNGVNFPTDLRNRTVVISVEPYPDNSAEPFTLKPLAVNVPGDISDHTSVTFGNGPVVELTGTVMR